MNRRSFLKASAGSVALSSFLPVLPAAFAAEPKPKRVGLIGTGWYGKSDLLRLIQISPVEVVSLCDVDKKMLAEAARGVGVRWCETNSSAARHGSVPSSFRDGRATAGAVEICMATTQKCDA